MKPAARLAELLNMDNIADELDDVTLNRIGADVVRDFEIDLSSRVKEGWDKRNEKAMKAAMQVHAPKNDPWPGASNVKYPLLTVASIAFQARAYPAIVDGATLVKGRVLGNDQGQPLMGPQGPMAAPDGQPQWEVQPGAKRDRADRVANHMTWQLMFKMDGWEEDTDRMLLMLPIVGCGIRKSYYDAVLASNVSMMLAPEDFVINYWAKSIEAAPRYTHVLRYYPYEVHELVASEQWRPINVEVSQDDKSQSDDEDALVVFYEQHRRIDLDGDGYPEPYVVTCNKDGQVARIAPCFSEKDVTTDARTGKIVSIKRAEYFTKYPFIPAPDGSFYDIGFGLLLGDISASIDTIINQMIDAASLQNAQGGFLGAGVNIKSGNMRFKLGEWKRVDVGGGTLRDNILPLELPGPSAAMFQLLGLLIEAAKDITSVQDIMTGGPATAQTATTTMAQVEQGMKTFTGIFKRIHRAFRKELQILFRLNGEHLPEEEYFALNDAPAKVGRADYLVEDLDIVPVSDPALASDLQKMARADYLVTFVGNPDVNQRELTRRRLEAGNIQDIKTVMEVPEAPPDPQLLLELKKQSNERDATKAEIRAKDAATASSLVDTALKAAQLGAMNSDAAMAQFAADLAEESDQLARGVMAEAAHEGGQSEHPDGQGAIPAMGGASGDTGLPGIPDKTGGGFEPGMGDGGIAGPGASGFSGADEPTPEPVV
jgi:chaperonin GroES